MGDRAFVIPISGNLVTISAVYHRIEKDLSSTEYQEALIPAKI